MQPLATENKQLVENLAAELRQQAIFTQGGKVWLQHRLSGSYHAEAKNPLIAFRYLEFNISSGARPLRTGLYTRTGIGHLLAEEAATDLVASGEVTASTNIPEFVKSL